MMHLKSRLPILIAVAAALTAMTALAAASALGGNVKRFDSTVTLGKKNPFHGHVRSQQHACEVHRTVKVFHKQQGADGLYDKTKTNGKGKWSISASNVHGRFYAKVKRREEGAAGTTYICKRDVSPTRHFGGGGGY